MRTKDRNLYLSDYEYDFDNGLDNNEDTYSTNDVNDESSEVQESDNRYSAEQIDYNDYRYYPCENPHFIWGW